MPKTEEPLSNDHIWQKRQPESEDISVLSNDSQNLSSGWLAGVENRKMFRSDSNSSLESYASAVSSLNDR